MAFCLLTHFTGSDRAQFFYAIMRPFSPQFDGSAHAERTFFGDLHKLRPRTKLKSGSWRAQVRRKGKHVNETFLRRKDAEEWALETERRIDRGQPTVAQMAARR
jgi:hypothetical protein